MQDAKAVPRFEAIDGTKANAHKMSSPINMILDSGTVTRLVKIKSSGNW
jgi:hypothetical protein